MRRNGLLRLCRQQHAWYRCACTQNYVMHET